MNHRRKLTPASDPSEVVERLYMLSEALKLADAIVGEVWGALDNEREITIEAYLTPAHGYSLDFKEAADRLTTYADGWQDFIDDAAYRPEPSVGGHRERGSVG